MDGKHDFSQNEQNSEQDEEYSFLDETVKERPLPAKKILMRVLTLAASAVLFGLIAGLVFAGVTGRPDKKNEGSGSDADYAAYAAGGSDAAVSAAESVASVRVSTESEAAAASAAPEAVSATPAPAASAESGSAASDAFLTENEKDAAAAAEKSVVSVTGMTSVEDWFRNTDSASSTVSGLVVAENDTSVLVLAEYSRLGAPERIIVTFPDGTMTDAQLLKEDPVSGLAILTVQLDGLGESTRSSFSTATLGNSYTVRTGDLAIAIGSPMGYSNAVACGHVTSTDAGVSVTDGEFGLIATDLEGSSQGSGVIINADGDVIAVILPKYAASGSSVVAGVGISYLKSLIATLSENGRLGYLGIEGETVTKQLSAQLGVPVGVYVNAVDADSPALAAGIAAGDVITEIGGNEVDSVQMLHSRLTNYTPGEEVQVKVMRVSGDGYKEFDFRAVIGEM